MITRKELNDGIAPSRTARNLKKSPMRFMSRGALTPIQEMSLQDTPPRSMNFAGLGETAATAAPVAVVEAPAKPATPTWLKWAGVAAAAGLVYWLVKRKG